MNTSIYLIIIAVLIGLFIRYNNRNKIIRTLVRQAARWSTAAEQDASPMIAVLHANYGVGYLWALKDIATAPEILLATGIDIRKFESEIVNVQDRATVNMIKVCPSFGPEPTYLSSLGGEGI